MFCFVFFYPWLSMFAEGPRKSQLCSGFSCLWVRWLMYALGLYLLLWIHKEAPWPESQKPPENSLGPSGWAAAKKEIPKGPKPSAGRSGPRAGWLRQKSLSSSKWLLGFEKPFSFPSGCPQWEEAMSEKICPPEWFIRRRNTVWAQRSRSWS